VAISGNIHKITIAGIDHLMQAPLSRGKNLAATGRSE
jgi:hypothetical protein